MKNFVWLFVFVLDTVELATGNIFYATAGQKAILDCGVDHYIKMVSWYRGDNMICQEEKRGTGVPRKAQNELGSRSRIRQETKLEINKVKEEDAGRFSCRVDGNNFEHTLVVVSVLVSASPSSELEVHSKAKLHCEVKGLKPGSTVEWRRPDGSRDKQTVDIGSVNPEHAGNWVCVLTQDGKTHSTTLEIKVKEPATTTSSPTKSSKNNHNQTCPTCGNNSQSRGNKLNWWVWVAVGVGCFVMILLMVCVIFLCKTIKRRKKRILKMKKGRPGPKQYCQCNRLTAAARPKQGRWKEKPSALPLQPLLTE